MKKTVSNVLKHLVCISLCIVVILPFYMVFINSLKPKAEAARMSLALPTEWHFETYLEVIEEANLVQGFFNSLTYAGISTTIGVLGCAMAAFVMARNKTKINNFLYYFVICGLFFPIIYDRSFIQLYRDRRNKVPYCENTERNHGTDKCNNDPRLCIGQIECLKYFY